MCDDTEGLCGCEEETGICTCKVLKYLDPFGIALGFSGHFIRKSHGGYRAQRASEGSLHPFFETFMSSPVSPLEGFLCQC